MNHTILSLKSENVKRLHAVEITPTGNVVVIGGKNGQGKSSVLDSIEYALGGDPDVKMPVRRGEAKAKVVVDLGDLVVKRTFTAGGGTSLVVTNADGVPQKSPQAILDGLVGKLTFDPLAFSRQKPEVQAETLRVLVGLDFTAKNAEYQKIFDERTGVNREVKQLQARVAALAVHTGLPAEEESTAEILADQQKASEANSANQKRRDQLVRLREAQDEDQGSLEFQKGEVDRLRLELTAAEKAVKDIGAAMEARSKAISAESPLVEALQDTDLSKFKTRADEVETTNRKIRENKNRADLVKQFKAKTDEAEKLTDRLDKIESAKREATTSAKYPVEGLLFDASGGITLNGIPFEQCSTADQLKVSIAVGFALNPTLRVLLIRDGSLLDPDSMAIVHDMAKVAGAQIWMERVGTDAQTSVVIEDGSVLEPTPEPAEGKLL